MQNNEVLDKMYGQGKEYMQIIIEASRCLELTRDMDYDSYVDGSNCYEIEKFVLNPLQKLRENLEKTPKHTGSEKIKSQS